MNPAAQPDIDATSREIIRTSLDESLIVEASAGTGKTTELVKRIVAILAAGRARINQIVAVTFTHKAAGELKLRLRQELDRQRAGSPLLEEALERLEEAAIGTIHSFCAQLLRERPVEARVDPAFEELAEQETSRIYDRAFRSWLEEKLNGDSPALRRAFARLAWPDPWERASPMAQLAMAGRRLVEWRDHPAPWRTIAFAREEEIDTVIRLIRELAAMSRSPRNGADNLFKALRPVHDLDTWIERSEAGGPRKRDYDTLEALLLKLPRDLRRDLKKGSGLYSQDAAREDLLQRRLELLEWLDSFRRRADAHLAATLREEMRGLVDRYQDVKNRSGKLDFVDLLLLTRDLLRDNPEVRCFLQQRYTHIFIDEFQDTDPLQAEILLLLASGDPGQPDWRKCTPVPGKLFVVGDPKQSIYKFRRADVVLYKAIRDGLIARGVRALELRRSFRAVRPIQHLVNAAFETEMREDAATGQAGYSPLEEDRPAPEGRPSIVVLPAPKPYATVRIAKSAINTCLPDAVVGFLHWLIKESGWGFEARDVAILFRRFLNLGDDLTRGYVRALESRGIAHLLAGSKSLHKREELETMRAALTAIEWPDDELSVFATLRGALFAIDDGLLVRYRLELGKRLHPFRKKDTLPADFQPIEEALDTLAALHRQRNRRPFADTVNHLLARTRAHAGFVARPGGRQVLANVARIAELARTYELTGGFSFRGFVEELAAQAEKAETTEAPILEEDADGVRLMTVHGAKGLEFPVVILADMTANLAAMDPERWVDSERGLCAMRLLKCAPSELFDNEAEERERERAEGIRVAYVAATRARDLLVIPAVGDEPFTGWLAPFNKAIYPSHDFWRKSRRAPGCPKFGESTVAERPLELQREGDFSVRPGLHAPQSGAHEVVWWDAAKLVSRPERRSTVLKDLLAADGGASLARYQAWQAERERKLSSGKSAEFEIHLASSVVAPPPEVCTVDTVLLAPDTRSASGRRFGILVHSLLRDVPFFATRAEIEALALIHARVAGATENERFDAVEAVSATLAHQLIERARRSARCHREYPVLLRLGNAQLFEGVIDLAFVEDNTWHVVDFKTDAAAMRDRYELQVSWYAYALSQLTGMPGRGWLMGV